jgi:hypothetical protein
MAIHTFMISPEIHPGNENDYSKDIASPLQHEVTIEGEPPEEGHEQEALPGVVGGPGQQPGCIIQTSRPRISIRESAGDLRRGCGQER